MASGTKQRGCVGKQRHDTRRDAIAAIASLGKRRGAFTPRLTAYQCKHCDGWHVGHIMSRRGR